MHDKQTSKVLGCSILYYCGCDVYNQLYNCCFLSAYSFSSAFQVESSKGNGGMIFLTGFL